MNQNPIQFPGRAGLQQRVLPAYRAAFFDLLATTCTQGLSVFAGRPQTEEAIQTTDQLQAANYVQAKNRHFGRTSSSFYLCWQSGLISWLNDWQPDVLIVEANPRIISTRFGANWMHTRKRPVIGWGLGVPQAREPSEDRRSRSIEAARQPGRQRFLSTFDGIIAYSQRGADEYRAMGFPEQRVFVATNAVAPRPSEPPPQRSPDIDQRLTVLFVGRLQRRKRIDNLLQACAALPPELQPKVRIIGEGPELDELRALAETIYPLAQFPGAKHGDDLEQEFARADLFILPGSGGLAIQQAMAHGLPVIAAEGDGTQEDLVRAENGWRVPANDLSALIFALRQALSDVKKLRKMGEYSYRIVRDEANLETMVDVFVSVLQKLRAAD